MIFVVLLFLLTSHVYGMETTTTSMPLYTQAEWQIIDLDGGFVVHLPSKNTLVTKYNRYTRKKRNHIFRAYNDAKYEIEYHTAYRETIPKRFTHDLSAACVSNPDDSILALSRARAWLSAEDFTKSTINEIQVYPMQGVSADSLSIASPQCLTSHAPIDPTRIDGPPLSMENRHAYPISSVAFLSNNQLLSTSTDKAVKIWDVATLQCSATMLYSNSAKWAIKGTLLRLSDNGFIAAYWNKDFDKGDDPTTMQGAKLYDTRADISLKLKNLPTSTTCMSKSSHDQCFLVGNAQSCVEEWDLRNTQEPCSTFGHASENAGIKSIAMYKNIVMSIDDNNHMHLWMPGFTQCPVQTIKLPSVYHPIDSPSWNDHQMFVEEDGTLHIANDRCIYQYKLIANHEEKERTQYRGRFGSKLYK